MLKGIRAEHRIDINGAVHIIARLGRYIIEAVRFSEVNSQILRTWNEHSTLLDHLPPGNIFTDNELLSFLTKQPAVNLCDNLRHTNKVEHCFRGTSPHEAITQSVSHN